MFQSAYISAGPVKDDEGFGIGAKVVLENLPGFVCPRIATIGHSVADVGLLDGSLKSYRSRGYEVWSA